MVKEVKVIYQSDSEKQDIEFWKQVSSEEIFKRTIH